ncbi:MAG: FGGY family carbohydrate kinase [Chloroflexota bacterium]
MQHTIIGVDLGTTSIKAVAFGLDGTQLAKESTPTITHYPRSGWAYFEPEEIWDAICLVLRRLVAKLPAGIEPGAIAFTGMAEAGVPLDEQGQPTHNIIAWFDKRTEPQSDWWLEHIGMDETAQITGLPVKPAFGILKLLWIRQNAPDAFRATRRWLNMADYGAFRLCGAMTTDYSLASRMMVLDLAKRAWSKSLLDAIELPANILGELVQGGTELGYIHAEAASATGLPKGLPVCSGGHDHVCAGFALGLIEPGDALDSMGTAESMVLTTAQPRLEPAITKRGIGQGIHVMPGRNYAMSGLNFASGSIDWSRQLLLSAVDDKLSYEKLIELATSAPPGSDGLFFVPHLRRANPPHIDIRGRGAFIGITSDADTSHFARAVVEGVAYDYQQAFDNTTDTFGLEPNRQVATGGGTRNSLLMEIKAHLSGLTINVPEIEEATCLGAATLAGVGAGFYHSYEDAVNQLDYVTRKIEPDPIQHRFYQERYQTIYSKLYNTLRDVNHQISQLI